VFRPSSDTLGGDLIANGGGRVITLEVKRRVKLTGAELEEFRIKVGQIPSLILCRSRL
jgi:cleavage and polyadenylation specificity factor subunit 2